jgi:hypothetical protein
MRIVLLREEVVLPGGKPAYRPALLGVPFSRPAQFAQ